MRRALAKLFPSALGLLTCIPQAAMPADMDKLAITGAVARPLNLQISDLEKMPRVSVEVKDHDGNLITYEGVPLVELLEAAGAPIGEKLRGANMASYIVAEAKDGLRRERKAVAGWPGTVSDRSAAGETSRALDSHAAANTGCESSVEASRFYLLRGTKFKAAEFMQ